MPPELSAEERQRYSRQVILPEVGTLGQQKLKAAKVLIVGAGGLGSPTALYLAAAGIGYIGLVDNDNVDLTNLHRQVIHGAPDIGRNKLDSAEESIQAINSNTQVVKHKTLLTSQNALELLAHYDLVIDGTDNFPTRYLVNDACVLLGKKNIYGSVFRFDGQASVFCAPHGPCYRCLYPIPPKAGAVPDCAQGGVLGVLPGIVGLIQATEAIKSIVELGSPLIGRLLLYDALAMRFRELKIPRNPHCPICGDHPTITELIDYQAFCGLPNMLKEIEPSELQALQTSNAPLQLIDVREPAEFEETRIPGSVLIPLGQLPTRLQELNPALPTVIHCRSGARSAKACQILTESGFPDVSNLKGGILAWTEYKTS